MNFVQSSQEQTNQHELSPRRQSLAHRAQTNELQDDASQHQRIESMLRGAVSTTQKNTFGIGVVQLVVTAKDQSYRAAEVIELGPAEGTDNAAWLSLRSNTSLQRALKQYGADLLAYDSRHRQTSFEAFSFPLFENESRSVRVLVRKPDDADSDRAPL